jgi:hypothetical protein
MTVLKCLHCDTDYPKEEIVNGTLTEIGFTCPICIFNERKYYE